MHIHGAADERVFYESNVTDPSPSNPDVVEIDAANEIRQVVLDFAIE